MQFKKQIPLFLLVLVVILSIRSTIIEPFRIPTRSMLPGLMMGDFLFANKFIYGFHLPFTESFSSGPIYLGKTRGPDYGDVIIFTPPEAGQENLYIKRVVGLPGDTVSFEGKRFYLNDEPLDRVEITGPEREATLSHPGFDPEERYHSEKLHIYEQTLHGKTYTILEDDSFEAIRSPQNITIPPDHYFVLGDNRDDTRDSRVFGVIPFSSIRGKAFVIWMSYRMSMRDSNWSFRPERIGKMIR